MLRRRSVTAQAVMWVQACAAGIEAGCSTALGTTCLRPLLYKTLYITIIHYGVETPFFALTPQPLNNEHFETKSNHSSSKQNGHAPFKGAAARGHISHHVIPYSKLIKWLFRNIIELIKI